jgi:hypothetical protein
VGLEAAEMVVLRIGLRDVYAGFVDGLDGDLETWVGFVERFR